MNDKLRIVYMGTPDFAVPPLKKLIDDGYDIPMVITQPDKARDRGKKIQPSPVKAAAMVAGLTVMQPEKLKNNDEFINLLKKTAPDIIVVAAYGKILPVEILNIPKLGCINIHGSLLPKFRGAAPIQRCIMSGDEKTGVTLMYMAEGMDTGDMIAKAITNVGKKTSGDLYEELAQLGAELLSEYLPRIAKGDISPVAQDDSMASYAPMISKEEGHIDFSGSAAAIERLIRAMPLRPGAYADYQGVQMKVRGADVRNISGDAEPGTIIDISKNAFSVACGEGILDITSIQMPGKKITTVADFLKGNKLEKGAVLK